MIERLGPGPPCTYHLSWRTLAIGTLKKTASPRKVFASLLKATATAIQEISRQVLKGTVLVQILNRTTVQMRFWEVGSQTCIDQENIILYQKQD